MADHERVLLLMSCLISVLWPNLRRGLGRLDAGLRGLEERLVDIGVMLLLATTLLMALPFALISRCRSGVDEEWQ